jgi:hypothetical protein
MVADWVAGVNCGAVVGTGAGVNEVVAVAGVVAAGVVGIGAGVRGGRAEVAGALLTEAVGAAVL